jgi:hypothetical protein
MADLAAALPTSEGDFTVAQRRRKKRAKPSNTPTDEAKKPSREAENSASRPKKRKQKKAARSYSQAAASKILRVRIRASEGTLTGEQIDALDKQVDDYLWERDICNVTVTGIRRSDGMLCYLVANTEMQDSLLLYVESVKFQGDFPTLVIDAPPPPPPTAKCHAVFNGSREVGPVRERILSHNKDLNPEGFKIIRAEPIYKGRGQMLVLALSQEWLDLFKSLKNRVQLGTRTLVLKPKAITQLATADSPQGEAAKAGQK